MGIGENFAELRELTREFEEDRVRVDRSPKVSLLSESRLDILQAVCPEFAALELGEVKVEAVN